jgi:thiamine-phosphate pyrophosphorylase
VTPPRLIAFTDLEVAPKEALLERAERASAAAEPESVLFVLRDKERPTRERLELGRALAALARRTGQRFGVADRLDLALLLDAGAIHLGEGSVETADARRLLGGRTFVTRAVHAPEAAPLTEADGVVFSPVIEPRKGKPAWGLGGLLHAREKLGSRGPALYALGGVSAENAAACLASGATGVAVIGALFGSDDPTPLLGALAILRH